MREELPGSAHLFDYALDGGGGLCTDSEPFVCLFQIKSVVLAFDHWVVGPELLDVASVATLTAIDGYDFVVGTVLRTFACKSESYHKVIGGGARKLWEFRFFAKVFLSFLKEKVTFLDLLLCCCVVNKTKERVLTLILRSS